MKQMTLTLIVLGEFQSVFIDYTLPHRPTRIGVTDNFDLYDNFDYIAFGFLLHERIYGEDPHKAFRNIKPKVTADR